MIDLVHLDGHGLLYVVAEDLEVRVAQQVLDIGARPGVEVVQADDLVILGNEPFAQV